VIANSVLKEVTGEPTAAINMMVIPMQPTETTIDKFVALNSIFAAELSLLYVLPVFNMVFFIVKEKEQRMKESMRMMGMNDLSYWVSWFVYYSATNLVTALLATMTLWNVFPHTDITIVFMIIWGYGQSLFGEIFMMQALFKKAKYAGILSAVFYFLFVSLNLILLPFGPPDWVDNSMDLIP